MPTLILPPRYNCDTNAMAKAAVRAGWDTQRLMHWRVTPDLADRGELVLYGEPLFAAVVADQLNLALIEPPFSWLADLPQPYRLRDVQLTTLGQARALDHRAFIKPADDKCFRAGVYERGRDLPAHEVLDEQIPVLVSEVVQWDAEFRCFALDRCVQTLSIYVRGGRVALAEDGSWPAEEWELRPAGDFAQSVLDDPAVRVPPALALDVGRLADGRWAVIEANCAWGSGIYGCDPQCVLPVLQRASRRADQACSDDAPWIIDRSASDDRGEKGV